MKKILFITLLFLGALAGFSQTVTNNFKDGNWKYYDGICWGIGPEDKYFGTDVLGNGAGFNGTDVCQTAQLKNKSQICRLESPWIDMKSGKIQFDHVMKELSGTIYLKVIAIKNVTNEEFQLASIKYDDHTLKSVSIDENLSGIYKIQWKWEVTSLKEDMKARGQIDNIVIPGTNVSDPSHNCDVYIPCTDTDKDGVCDNEDQYPNDPDRAYDNYYPATGFGTIAFEDNWPAYGDYDLNDLVMGYKFKIVSNAQHNVVEIFNTMLLRANGAGMENGFGYQLPNVNPTSIRSVTGTGDQTGYTIGANGTETGNPTNATIIVFDRSHRYMNEWNTQLGVAPVPAYQFDIYLEFMKNGVPGPGGAISVTNLNIAQWNPFLVVNGQRGREVHLPNYLPTDQADVTLFGTGDDDTRIGHYYKSKTNLPWALDIYGQFDYPAEHMDISLTYLHFGAWVESSGSKFLDWWSNKGTGYRDNAKIY